MVCQMNCAILDCFAQHGNLFHAHHIILMYSDKVHVNLGQCLAMCVYVCVCARTTLC
jgi:hypothetical protein